MKKLLLFLLLLPLLAQAQQIFYAEEVDIRDSLIYNKGTDTLFTGELLNALFITDNNIAGTPLFQPKDHPNLQIRKRTHYKHGKKHGLELIYNKQGILEEEVFYSEGKKHGINCQYRDGILTLSVSYKNGLPDGPYFALVDNNTILEEGAFKEDKMHGITKVYQMPNILIREIGYKDGEPHGIYREYYPSGKLHKEGTHLDGITHGIYREWNEKGKLIKEKDYSKEK